MATKEVTTTAAPPPMYVPEKPTMTLDEALNALQQVASWGAALQSLAAILTSARALVAESETLRRDHAALVENRRAADQALTTFIAESEKRREVIEDGVTRVREAAEARGRSADEASSLRVQKAGERAAKAEADAKKAEADFSALMADQRREKADLEQTLGALKSELAKLKARLG